MRSVAVVIPPTRQDNLELVDLPESYTELYSRAKQPHAWGTATADGSAGQEVEPAVCLICGQVRAEQHVVVFVWVGFLLFARVPYVGFFVCLTIKQRSSGGQTGEGSRDM